MERWVEHFSSLYFQKNISNSGLKVTEQLPVMEDLDEIPTMDELAKTKVIDQMERLQNCSWGHQEC